MFGFEYYTPTKVYFGKEKENEVVILDNDGIDIDTFRMFKKTLVAIKRNQYESEVKDNFIIHAHSLFLFMEAYNLLF